MIKRLIITGLITIPFLSGLHLDPILSLGAINLWEIKECIALMIALAIGLFGYYSDKQPPVKNIYLILLVLFMLLSTWLSPHYKGETGALWLYKPLMPLLIYAMMFFSISSLKLSRKDINLFLNILVWCGFIMSSYIIVQSLNIDQYYIIKPPSVIGHPKNVNLVGTIGEPTFTAAYMMLCIPSAIFLKKWFKLFIIIMSVLLIGSQMATGAMIIGIALYLAIKNLNKKGLVVAGVSSLMIAVIFFLSVQIQDNGRFLLWKQVFKNWHGPVRIIEESAEYNDTDIQFIRKLNSRKYPITGTGLGSYRFVDKKQAKSTWGQVHNEYLEFLRNAGMVGVVLLLLTMFHTVVINFNRIRQGLTLPLLITFITGALCAFGNFIWQVEPTRWICVLIIALLHNRSVLNGAN